MPELTLIDETTGLLNRRGFYVAADPALCTLVRRGYSCLVALLEVDDLPAVHDEHGGEVADEMLCDVATVLLQTLRRSDVLARPEADEFCIFAADPTGDPAGLRTRVEGALRAFNSTVERPYILSATIGLAHVTPSHDDTLDDLIAIAREDLHKQRMSQNQTDRRHLQPLRVVTEK